MFIDVVLTVFCFTLFFLIWSQTMTSTNSTQMTPYRARRAARMIEKSNNQCNSSSNGYDTTVTPSLRTVTPSNCQLIRAQMSVIRPSLHHSAPSLHLTVNHSSRRLLTTAMICHSRCCHQSIRHSRPDE